MNTREHELADHLLQRVKTVSQTDPAAALVLMQTYETLIRAAVMRAGGDHE